MLPDRVSNPGPLTYESGALPIALLMQFSELFHVKLNEIILNQSRPLTHGRLL